MSGAYEATFLMAVATAYFLALNAVVGYLLQRIFRMHDVVRDLTQDLRSLGPRLRAVDALADVLIEVEQRYEEHGGKERG